MTRTARVKKIGIILLASAAGVWLLVSLVRDFFDSIEYFSTEPRRLFYVVGLVIVGGLATLAFARFSHKAQRRVRLCAFGVAASTLTLGIGYIIVRLPSVSSLVVESGAMFKILVALLLLTALATYLWFEFSRACKEESSHDTAANTARH
jgi:hypothetical protein